MHPVSFACMATPLLSYGRIEVWAPQLPPTSPAQHLQRGCLQTPHDHIQSFSLPPEGTLQLPCEGLQGFILALHERQLLRLGLHSICEPQPCVCGIWRGPGNASPAGPGPCFGSCALGRDRHTQTEAAGNGVACSAGEILVLTLLLHIWGMEFQHSFQVRTHRTTLEMNWESLFWTKKSVRP